MLMPVMLPPGRLMLLTIPALTGSLPEPNTIGMVEVVFLAANTEASPPTAISTETWRLTRSFARAGNRP